MGEAVEEAWGTHNIVLEGIDGVVHIEQLTIEQQWNDHGKVSLTMIMDDSKIDSLLLAHLSNRRFILRDRYQEDRILFQGIIKNSVVERVQGIYTARLEGISYTYNLDIKRLRRSFQNKNMTYSELFKRVLEGYDQAGVICSDRLRKEPLKRFVLQYDETDWAFIKRVASRSNQGLLADITMEGPKFYIGMPEGRAEKELPQCPYRVSRDLAWLQRVKTNGLIAQIDEQDSLQVELRDLFDNYELGDRVRFQNKSLYIARKVAYLSTRDGILRYRYILRTLRGSQQEKIVHEGLKGNSIPGTVIDVKSHYTKLHLHMDAKQDKETAIWFSQPTYFTGGEGKGYGTMPELGEVLYLHFPMNYEEANYVISSDGNDMDQITSRVQASTVNPEPPKKQVKTSPAPTAPSTLPSKTAQPLTDETITRSKQWFSPGNKSLLLDEQQVKLHATGGAAQLTLQDGGGIMVTGAGSIDLTAKNLRVNPDFVGEQETIPSEGVRVSLSAGKSIALLCEGSSLLLSEEEQSIDIVSDNITLESPENPKDIQVMAQDAVEALLAEYEAIRLSTQPVFRSDGTRVVADELDVLQLYYIHHVIGEDKYRQLMQDKGGQLVYQEQFASWRRENYGQTTHEKNMAYVGKSTKFMIQGNYSEEGATGLGIGGNILLGIFGVDIAADVRDLIHNFTHWEWSWGHGGEVVLNGMGLFPFVGVVKNLKYSDEVADIAKNAESIDDLIKGINKIGGFKDVAGNPLVIKKLADGSYEMLDASGNLINKIDDMPGLLEQMGVKIGKGPEVPKGTGEGNKPNLYDKAGNYTGGRTQKELDDLARDPASNGKIEPKNIREREVGLAVEERGQLGKLVRDPQAENGAEFIDTSSGLKWDVKSFESYPSGDNGIPITNPKKGAFTIKQGMKKLQKEFDNGNNVIIDTRKMEPEHVEQLKKAIDEEGVTDKIIWYP